MLWRQYLIWYALTVIQVRYVDVARYSLIILYLEYSATLSGDLGLVVTHTSNLFVHGLACSLLELIDLIEFNFDTPISIQWILCRVLEFSPFLDFFS
jgi:hypothetical protein